MPPKIIEEKSTISPGPILEGESLTLFCHTEGIPKPKVSWFFRRRASSSPSGSSAAASAASSSHHHHHSNAHDHRAIIAQHSSSSGHHQHFKNGALNHDQVLQEGDRLVIKNVSRFYSSGVFECIANNSVPPAASRKIRVSVECKAFTIFGFSFFYVLFTQLMYYNRCARVACSPGASGADGRPGRAVRMPNQGKSVEQPLLDERWPSD